MSFQYVNETSPDETSVEEAESVQRAQPIFPLYSVILIASLIAVTVGQIAVDGSASIFFGGNISAALAGFDKQAFTSGEYWRILTGAVCTAA